MFILNVLKISWYLCGRKKYDNIKREFIDFIEVNLICAELVSLKKYDNYQDYVK